jgi:hypothetical protein
VITLLNSAAKKFCEGIRHQSIDTKPTLYCSQFDIVDHYLVHTANE